MKPLCTGAKPYVTPPGDSGWTIQFQVCGLANVDCVPQYLVTYNRGAAVQFVDSNVPINKTCENATGAMVPCTANCEVLGIGAPILTGA